MSNTALRSDPALIEAEAKDFFALMKPRVMVLVLWTGLAGLWLAPAQMPLALAIAALLFMAMGSGGAAALNMWYERNLDGLMARTASRPLPAGRITSGEALGFGISLSVASIIGMALCVHWLAALGLALTIGFYVGVYTMWLKPRTAQNIVIGGAAGAMPPLIGWAAAAESLALMPFWMFLIIFIWTPVHFWPLALRMKSDYEKARLPMMPGVVGEASTCRQILAYTLVLLPVSFLPMLSGAGWLYGIGALLLGAELLRLAYLLWRKPIAPSVYRHRLFLFSMIYLFGIFALLMADHVVMRYV